MIKLRKLLENLSGFVPGLLLAALVLGCGYIAQQTSAPADGPAVASAAR
ncbi:MAG TPA: hypothetical protein VMI15_04100 [Burkholderiales bacterium]|nr:hypothetical protein [Burkholderiales bacterium]